MNNPNRQVRLAKIIAWLVLAYGGIVLVSVLLRQRRVHREHDFDALFLTLPGLLGISYAYLGTLLLRLKRNAWLVTLGLSVLAVGLNVLPFLSRRHALHAAGMADRLLHIAVLLALIGLLFYTRAVFRVRSDMVGFRQAVRASVLVLLIAFVYGTAGFALLDEHDFHQEISLPTALHQTADQLGVTTTSVVPHTRRAVIFVDSLSAVSIAALGYTVLAFFQPIRFRLQSQARQRRQARQLLQNYPHDIDDFFKLWPHDKHYFFDRAARAGLAYHVTGGVALVVGDPFGDAAQFNGLVLAFQDFCFVNDWRPAFVHVSAAHAQLYEQLGFRLQKIGEEAVLHLPEFAERRNDKYFRHIRNRFAKLGYQAELMQLPHSRQTLQAVRAVSASWLTRPGRTERGFMLGNHTNSYMQQSELLLARDKTGSVHGFMNIVPTYTKGLVNYDLLRCDSDAPGNCNDFVLLSAIDVLLARGNTVLNLGLCPLKGLDDDALSRETVVGAALQLLYAKGGRFYSFTGLERFKAKYQPAWEPRYVAYLGGAAGFARVARALNRAMKIK